MSPRNPSTILAKIDGYKEELFINLTFSNPALAMALWLRISVERSTPYSIEGKVLIVAKTIPFAPLFVGQ